MPHNYARGLYSGKQRPAPAAPGTFMERQQPLLENEAMMEEQYRQQRLAGEQQFRAALPPAATPTQPNTVQDYIRGMTQQGTARPQPGVQAANGWADFPTLLGILQRFGVAPRHDVQVDDRLIDERMGRRSGDMAMNNQRLRRNADDYDRERARSQWQDGRK